MNIKVGTDIVNVARIEEWQQNKPELIQGILSNREIQRQDPEHIAGLIAAKEAAMKALQLPPGSWKEIMIHYSGSKPLLTIQHKQLQSIDVSISHDKNYAIAVVIAILSSS